MVETQVQYITHLILGDGHASIFIGVNLPIVRNPIHDGRMTTLHASHAT